MIHDDLDVIERKLRRMPTTRECVAFLLGFAMCAALLLSLALVAA